MSLFLWVIFPYVCLTIFVVGHYWRYRYDKFGWTTRSSQLYESRLLRIGSPMFHFGILVVFLGHVMGLGVPKSWTAAVGISEGLYHLMAVTLGAVAGFCTVVGLAILGFGACGDPRDNPVWTLGGEPGLLFTIKQYYELNALEEGGRCKAPLLEGVSRSRVVEDEPGRFEVDLAYYYRDMIRDGGDDCDRLPNAGCRALRECRGFAERSFVVAREADRPAVLVGAMYSVQRGERGPTPGGPITRWHSHVVCIVGQKRGLKPRANGTCPPKATASQGSEMMHVWFTNDLRSAFAIGAPEPELCRLGLLSSAFCRNPGSRRGM